MPRIDENIATAALGPEKSVGMMEYHYLLGHVSKATKSNSALLQYQACGKIRDLCRLRKSEGTTENVLKGNNTVQAERNAEGLFFDIGSIKAKSYGGSKFWLLVVDNKTDFAWSYFLKNKSDMPNKITGLIKQLKTKYKYEVKLLHCDNAGENKSTKKLCDKLGFAVDFEFTAPDTPQQN
jgi:hypothetical protein